MPNSRVSLVNYLRVRDIIQFWRKLADEVVYFLSTESGIKLMKPFFSLCISLFLVMVMPASAMAAGYRLVEHDDFIVHVWYPTDTIPEDGRLGPFDVVQAVDAPLRAGTFQPVLMSHGLFGRARNHHLTAQALADAGFIAIAPVHAADHYIDTEKRAAALAWRVTELRHAVELVIRDEDFRDSMDLSVIHSVGYSLGTASILMGAGGGFDLGLINEHCEIENDPGFCERPGFIARWQINRARGVEVHEPDREVPDRFFSMPFINGRIALIAPLAKGLTVSESLFSAKGVYVQGFAKDRINLPRFHTQPYRNLIPSDRLVHFDIAGNGNHSAFIAPFAKRVTDIEHIDAAIDPPGFDRRAFLARLNVDLVSFFSEE